MINLDSGVETLDSVYNDVSRLWKGNPSPKFVNYEHANGDSVSLEDFRGSYIFIDVWATWCSPCKKEIPFLVQLEEEYHGKNIKFISISIDRLKDKEKWRQMVVEKELKGTHLIANNDFDSDFISAYEIFGVPRFILIDPNGNIITAKAPYPSSEQIRQLFDSHL